MAALDFPASPTNGQVYNNWVYSSSKGAWQSKPLTPGQAQPSATAPTSPSNGDQWYNTNDGNLYIYYNDGTSSQWVEHRSQIAKNQVGLTPITPTSVAVGSGTGSVASDGTVTFSGASNISINGCFSATFINYRILFNESSASDYTDGNLRLRASGTDSSVSYYRNGLVVDGTTITGIQALGDTQYAKAITTHNAATNAHAHAVIEIGEPFLTKPTTMQVINGGWSTYLRHISTTGFHTVATSYDGFTINLAAGTFGGTFKIYGYN